MSVQTEKNTSPVKHGMCRTDAYKAWTAMKKRCNNPRNADYPYYGGRGISYCARWESFGVFYADMGDRPDGMTLDRIDPTKGYNPENCRWATRKEQSCNKRNNVILTLNGVSKTLPEWAEELGIHIKTLRNRIKESGWSQEQALTLPVQLTPVKVRPTPQQ